MRRAASASGMGIGMCLRRSVTCPRAVHPSDDVEEPPAVHNDIDPPGELNVRKKAPPPPPPLLASAFIQDMGAVHHPAPGRLIGVPPVKAPPTMD